MYANHIQHYQKDAEQFDYFTLDKFMAQEFRRRYETIFHLFKIRSGDRILEIGSGGGLALKYIRNSGCSYFPLDISSSNLNQIKKNAEFDIFPITGDVYNISAPDSCFNIIILSEVLEHLAEPEKALMEMCRVLKPSGTVIVSVPYKEKLKYHLCIHCNRPTPVNAHLHSFDEHTLRTYFKKAGLTVIKEVKIIDRISNRLYLNRILKQCPFIFWKRIDGFFNKLFNKPTSLVILGEK